MNYDSIIILDFETTGLEDFDQPVEVAWIEITEDLDKVDEFSSLIKPTVPINPAAINVHGITEEMVKDAPSLREVLAPFRGPLGVNWQELVIAHNASFDRRFIAPFANVDILCTRRLAAELLPDAQNNKLSTLAAELGLEATPTHRALADVETCLSFLRYIRDTKGLSLTEMKGISDEAVPNMKMPFGRHKNILVKDLPRSYVSWMRKEMTLNGDLLEALNIHFK